MSTRSRKIMSLESRARPERKTGNLTIISDTRPSVTHFISQSIFPDWTVIFGPPPPQVSQMGQVSFNSRHVGAATRDGPAVQRTGARLPKCSYRFWSYWRSTRTALGTEFVWARVVSETLGHSAWVPGIFLGVNRGRRVSMAVSPPSVSWCRKHRLLATL
jgi:hypothetical protein